MAIYTPTGLKIRISVKNSFGLMSRLFPKVTPFKFLKSVEGLELLPAVFAFITGIVCFLGNYNPIIIGLSTLIAYLTGLLCSFVGIFDKTMLSLGIYYSYLSGYGVFLITATVVGYLKSGFQGIIAYFVAIFLGFLFSNLLNLFYTTYSTKKYGFPYTGSERSFFKVYDFYAFKNGISSSLKLTDKEINEDLWKISYKHLEKNWPQITHRFNTESEYDLFEEGKQSIMKRRFPAKRTEFPILIATLQRELLSLREQWFFSILSTFKSEGVDLTGVDPVLRDGSDIDSVLKGYQVTSIMGFAMKQGYLTITDSLIFSDLLYDSIASADREPTESYNKHFLGCGGNIDALSRMLSEHLVRILWASNAHHLVPGTIRRTAPSLAAMSQAVTASVFGDAATERRLKRLLNTR